MKILNITLILLISQNLFSQIYNFPDIDYRINQTTSILKVEINYKYTIVEEEYICSYKYDSTSYYNINKNSFIKSNGRFYKLLKAEGIEISPKKSYCIEKGSSNKYKLYFEKIKPSKEIDIIEDSVNGGFNFYGVKLKNNKEQSELNKAKSDEFLKYLPEELFNVFLYNDYIYKKDRITSYLDDLIENNKSNIISKITFNEEEKYQYYFCELKNIENITGIEFYQLKDSKLPNGFEKVSIYCNDKEAAIDLYNKITNYFEYPKKEDQFYTLKHFFYDDKQYMVLVGFYKMESNLYEVSFKVFDKETFYKLTNKKL